MGAMLVLKSTHYNFVKLAEKFLLHKIANALNQVRDKASRPCSSDVTNNQNPALLVTPTSPKRRTSHLSACAHSLRTHKEVTNTHSGHSPPAAALPLSSFIT